MKEPVPYLVGIDVGSTTVKLVLTEQDKLIFHKYIRHFAKQRESIISLLEEVKPLIQDKPFKVCMTGSGARIIADKIEVVSTSKIFRRTKDLFDLYNICISNDFEKALIIDSLNRKNKILSDFSAFKNKYPRNMSEIIDRNVPKIIITLSIILFAIVRLSALTVS